MADPTGFDVHSNIPGLKYIREHYVYYNEGIRLPPAAERQEVSYNVRKLTHLSGSSSCFLFSFFSTDISRFVCRCFTVALAQIKAAH